MTIEEIKKQPFFGPTKRDRLVNQVVSYAARQLLDNMAMVNFKWGGSPKAAIRMQPFFGKDSSLPDRVTFRRPAPYTDTLQDAMTYGTGLKDQLVEKTPNAAEQAIDIWFGKSINDPRDVWDMKTPVYTLEDIGWKSYGS